MLRFLLSLGLLFFCFNLQAQFKKVHTFKDNVQYIRDFQSTSHLIEVDKNKGRVNWYHTTDFSLYLSVDLYIPSGYTLDSLYSHDYILDTSSGSKFGYVVKSGSGNSIGIICNEKGKLIKQFPDCVSMKIFPAYYRYKLAVVKLKGGNYTTDVCRVDSNFHVEKTYPTSNLQTGHVWQKNYTDTFYFRYFYVNTKTEEVVVHGFKHQRIRTVPITVPAGATLRTTVNHFYSREINSDSGLEFGVYFQKNGVYSAKIINEFYEVQSFSNAAYLEYYDLNQKKMLVVSSRPTTIAKRDIQKIDDSKDKNIASSWLSVNGRFSYSEYYGAGIGVDIDSMSMFHYESDMSKNEPYTVDLGLNSSDEIISSTGYYQGNSDGDNWDYEAYYLWKSSTGKYTFNIKNNSGIELLKVNNARRFQVNSRFINNSKSQFSLLVPGSGVEIYEYDFSVKQPTRISPAHKSKQQDFKKLTFSWNKVKNAMRYTVTLFTDTNDWSTLREYSYIYDTTYTLENTLDSATVYYWKVTAGNSETGRANFAYHRFKTFDAGDIAAPTLISPANTSKDLDVSLRLTWSKVDDADGYEFQYSETPDFTTSSQGNVTTTYADISGLKNDQDYFWRVRAKKGVAVSDWSSSWYFTTAKKSTLSSPALLSPTNGASNTGITPTLSWQAVTGATLYTYEYGKNSDFSDGTSTNTTGLSAALSALDYNTTYYWRVRASDGTEVSAWSTAWSFGTGAKASVGTPTLLSPSNGATNESTSPTLSWETVTDATGYTYEYATLLDFSNAVSNTTTSTSAQLNALSSEQVYYWRVKAEKTGEFGNWSVVWSFETAKAGTPEKPVLSLPANNSTDIDPNNASLEWNAANNALSYEVQLSTDLNFSTFSTGTPSGLSITFTDLKEQTVYYWRVKSINGANESDWSDIWIFTTDKAESVGGIASTLVKSYPNPVTDVLHIEWNGATDATQNIKLFNTTGQLLLNEVARSASYQLDMAKFQSGVYWLQISNGEEQVLHRVVKR